MLSFLYHFDRILIIHFNNEMNEDCKYNVFEHAVFIKCAGVFRFFWLNLLKIGNIHIILRGSMVYLSSLKVPKKTHSSIIITIRAIT